MTGVAKRPPSAPRLVTVKVEPPWSAGAPLRAFASPVTRPISRASSRSDRSSARRTTGTISPSSVAVAIPMSYQRFTWSSPFASSSEALRSGCSRSAATAAFTLNGRKVSSIPCSRARAAARSRARARSAIRRRSPRSGITSTGPRWPDSDAEADAVAAGATEPARRPPASRSASVTLPPGPVPLTEARSIPCSRAAALTAGTALACEGVAEATGSARAGSPSTSSSRSVERTRATSPSARWSRATRPRRGDGIVTVALSVMTSTSGCSSATSSPGFTSQRSTSASTIPSPRSGRVVGTVIASPSKSEPRHLAHRLQDPRRARQVGLLQGVWERRVEPGDAGDGRLQAHEAVLLHEGRELRPEATGQRRLVDDDGAPRLRDRLDDGVEVERLEGAQVDHLAVDPLRLRLFGRAGRLVPHRAPGEQRDLRAPPGHPRLPERHRVVPLGHLPLRRAVDPLRLEEEDRVRIADGADEQPLRVVRIGRDDHLEPRGVDEEGLRRLRVVVATPDPTAVRRADHERAAEAAPGAVPVLGGLVHDLVDRREDEVGELDLRHGLEPVDRHPHRGPDDPALGERRVDHALGAELGLEPLRGAEDAAEPADVLDRKSVV